MELNKSELIFKNAELKDTQAITDLINSVYRGENAKKGWTSEADLLGGIRISKKRIEQIIAKPDDVILLGILEGKIAGCVHLEKKKNGKCYLGMLSVDVNYQNAKLGREILDKSDAYAKEVFGCSEMEIKVISVRKELIDYYLRRGYILTGQTEKFIVGKHIGDLKIENMEIVYMVKQLTNRK